MKLLLCRGNRPWPSVRSFKGSIVASGMDPEHLPESDPSKMDFGTGGAGAEGGAKKAWKDIWGAGQGVGAVKAVVPAAELVARLKREYEESKRALLA